MPVSAWVALCFCYIGYILIFIFAEYIKQANQFRTTRAIEISVRDASRRVGDNLLSYPIFYSLLFLKTKKYKNQEPPWPVPRMASAQPGPCNSPIPCYVPT